MFATCQAYTGDDQAHHLRSPRPSRGLPRAGGAEDEFVALRWRAGRLDALIQQAEAGRREAAARPRREPWPGAARSHLTTAALPAFLRFRRPVVLDSGKDGAGVLAGRAAAAPAHRTPERERDRVPRHLRRHARRQALYRPRSAEGFDETRAHRRHPELRQELEVIDD